MHVALFHSYNFKCPNCRLLVEVEKVSGREKAIVCNHCMEVLIVKLPSTVKKQKNKKATSPERKYLTVKKNIVQYGWASEEADKMILAALAHPEIPQEVEPSILLKFILANSESLNEQPATKIL